MDNTQHMLEKLRVEVAALNALLADPQPGLFTWCDAVAERWKAIAQLWGDQRGSRHLG